MGSSVSWYLLKLFDFEDCVDWMLMLNMFLEVTSLFPAGRSHVVTFAALQEKAQKIQDAEAPLFLRCDMLNALGRSNYNWKTVCSEFGLYRHKVHDV